MLGVTTGDKCEDMAAEQSRAGRGGEERRGEHMGEREMSTDRGLCVSRGIAGNAGQGAYIPPILTYPL